MFLVAGQADAVRAGPAVPARTAGQYPVTPLAPGMDRAERWCGESDEHARMVGDLGGDAFAAGQPGPDELVGVGPVDLGAGRAARGPAGLAGDRQEPAGLVHGRVAVDQLAGGPVDVIDTATQQHRLQAATGVPDRACGNGGGGQKVVLLSSGPRGRWTSGGRPQPGPVGVKTRWSAVLCRMGAWLELPAAQGFVCGWWHRDPVSGDLPARHLHGHPSMRGGPAASIPNTYPKYVADKIDTSSII